MRITPTGRSPETDSEKLLAEYLNAHKYHGWLFEPTVEGCSQRPDFVVPFDQQPLLFDAKERTRKGGEPGFAWIDPMAGIREKIEKARRKFKKLKDLPCSLVIYNAGDIDTLLEPHHVFGAMLGDPGLTLAYDDASGSLIAETARNVFLPQRGKMMRYKTGEMQNRTINAIIVLERRRLPDREFERARDAAIAAPKEPSGRHLSELEQRRIAVAIYLETAVKERMVVCVRVCEHPGARNPLPRALFRGPFDERWAMLDGLLTCIFEGGSVSQLRPG